MLRTQGELIFLFLAIGITTVNTQTCRDTGWEKVDGMMPENYKSGEMLYTGENSDGIISICFDRCLKANCSAFYVDITQSTCVKIMISSEDFEPAPSSIFFHKICVKVPQQCNIDRLWQVQRTLGAILIDSSVDWLPNVMTRSRCYQECLAAGSKCKAAQFRTSNSLAIADVDGKCALLSIERGIRPQSYRASMYRDEYLETECHTLLNTDYCSYAEFKNMTLPYSDIKIPNLNAKQCEERCDAANDGFICRGFTVNYEAQPPACLLHADDTISAGVSSLIKRSSVVYKEREACINLKVSCGNTSLVIELDTPEPFNGRIYTNGYSETCNVQGTGSKNTILKLKLPDKKEIGMGNIDCGILPAFAIDDDNQTRTAVWVTVVVQFNPIIQRLGDQSVRVGCTLDHGEVPHPRNITVGSGFTFSDPNAGLPPVIGTVFNTSEAPVVIMKILNDNGNEITSAELGQRLTLKIEIIPSDGPYDITAGHLVARSASDRDSILLLDEMGCPVYPTVFPKMFKDPTDNRSLISTFAAFKFPESYRVKFSVTIKFCMTKCEPIICRTDVSTNVKYRRAVAYVKQIDANSTNGTIDELSLDTSLIVRDATVAADPLRSGKNPDAVLIAGEKSLDGLLCVNAALALGLLIFWLIVQILLTVTCIYVIRRYRKLARKAEEDRADILARHLYGIHGGNFEIARRVRWADHNESSNS